MIKNSLRGKRAVVCGASAGIGRATAFEFARHQTDLFLIARRQSELEAVAKNCYDLGAGKVDIFPADLAQIQDWITSFRSLIKERGGAQILINNTGGPPPGPLLSVQPSTFIEAFSRILMSAHLLAQTLVPMMAEKQFGRIINIVSTSVREPIENIGVSNTIRSATAGWAKTLANELPPGVTINNVLPGYTDTERFGVIRKNMATGKGLSEEEIQTQMLKAVPERRLATAEEIANAVVFLASEEAAFIRGVSLPVDGGRLKSI